MTEEAKAEMLAMLAKLELAVERLKAERERLRAERDEALAEVERLKAERPVWSEQVRDPCAILIWPVRVYGRVIGWEVVGPHSGALGGSGVNCDRVLEKVEENLAAAEDRRPFAPRSELESDLRARLEVITAERDRLNQRAAADDRLAHRLSGQVDAAARHLGQWMALVHGPHNPDVDPDALVGRAIAALLGGEE